MNPKIISFIKYIESAILGIAVATTGIQFKILLDENKTSNSTNK
jgi:hypothetical protein